MADSAQDRNLPASARRIERARADGNLPRSRDLGHFAALAAGTAAITLAAEPLTAWAGRLLANGLRLDRRLILEPRAAGEHVFALVQDALLAVLLLGAVMAAAAFVAAFLAGGWNVSKKAVMPDFSRLSPLQGIKRLFAKQHLIDVIKVVLLAAAVGVAGTLYLRAHFQEMAGVLNAALPQAIAQVAATIGGALVAMLVVLGAWAMVDLPLQRHLWLERLKMTRQEVKQEQKESEGNVEIKAKIRARMREIVRRRMLAAVPTADLVVMNPTHYAVALKYDEAKMGAPRVIAKGADLLALKIRDLARDAKVPVLQAPPLARALYKHVEIDGEIPAALFTAVAQVLAWVYQLRRSPRPIDPPQVQVPPELDPLNAARGTDDAGEDETE